MFCHLWLYLCIFNEIQALFKWFLHISHILVKALLFWGTSDAFFFQIIPLLIVCLSFQQICSGVCWLYVIQVISSRSVQMLMNPTSSQTHLWMREDGDVREHIYPRISELDWKRSLQTVSGYQDLAVIGAGRYSVSSKTQRKVGQHRPIFTAQGQFLSCLFGWKV